jgi:hypothetical protein
MGISGEEPQDAAGVLMRQQDTYKVCERWAGSMELQL